MDKASTLKDAIVYIQDLQEQERRLQAEIMELESKSLKKDPGFDFEQELPVLLRPKKTRYDQIYDHRAPISYPIKVHEVSHSLELEWPHTVSSKQWRYDTERSLSMYIK